MRISRQDYAISFDGRQILVSFPSKPSAAVRSILKLNRFRWSRESSSWYRYKATADNFEYVDRALQLECEGSHGACEHCGAAGAKWVQPGWNEPERLLCPSCCTPEGWNRVVDEKNGDRVDEFDKIYEDECARQCGLI